MSYIDTVIYDSRFLNSGRNVRVDKHEIKIEGGYKNEHKLVSRSYGKDP